MIYNQLILDSIFYLRSPDLEGDFGILPLKGKHRNSGSRAKLGHRI